MTEENYKYRTSPLFLRNQFKGKGKLQIPVIPKFQIQPDDFNDLFLIGFDKISINNSKHFSMYVEMAPILHLYNTFRNRWCGAYFASKGIRVVPTVSWGDENTFEFCFDGIEKGSTVAVSTYMVSEHDNRQDQKEFFIKGYNEMLRRIEPEKIICYNTPFPEMQGDIVFVDYDRSSWRYMNDDPYVPSKYAKYICGEQPVPIGSNLVIKSGYVVSENDGDYNSIIQTGMGSAYGGQWKPAKLEDERFLGEPGEIKISYDKKGNRIDTKIGEDGRATRERHYTDHNKPWAHSNPHDHEIRWDNPTGHPDPQGPINYPENNVPEFKQYGRQSYMKSTVVQSNSFEENRFKTISDFKDCMRWHGEVEFEWDGKNYSITHPDKISISEANKQETEKLCSTADEVLEYKVGDDRLRNVITQVTVWSRTI